MIFTRAIIDIRDSVDDAFRFRRYTLFFCVAARHYSRASCRLLMLYTLVAFALLRRCLIQYAADFHAVHFFFFRLFSLTMLAARCCLNFDDDADAMIFSLRYAAHFRLCCPSCFTPSRHAIPLFAYFDAAAATLIIAMFDMLPAHSLQITLCPHVLPA